MNKVAVLRLGHRPGRDERVSTHVALVARAFGAEKVVFSDYEVSEVEKSVDSM